MTKKPLKAEIESKTEKAVPVESGETAPLDNAGRLRTHLKADSLALKLLDAWTGANPQTAKPALLKAVDNHFSKKD